MKDAIVLYPVLGRGHLVSMVELGKFILTHHPSFSITILILTPSKHTTQDVPLSPSAHDSNAKYIAAVSAAVPAITFHQIPAMSLPSDLPPHAQSLELSRLSSQYIHNALRSIARTSNIKAIVMDFLNYSATHVTSTLNIPTYFYLTSGASVLAVFLQLPTIHQNTTKSLKDLHMLIRIPGLPLIHSAEFPDVVKDRSSRSYQVYLDIATSMRDSDGVIVNTSDSIEGRAIRALIDGLCLPEGTTPSVFCIGPLISPPSGEEDTSGCLSWLDSQPSQSVMFLSFGSMGMFSKAQLKEMAIGLEKSEQRFLWVVRSESDGDNSEPSLDELLPEGFLERTKVRGMVVRNWAPQATILSHDSVGGFVTHCGWNSVLEAVCAGVPMVAWPLYAEQKLNKVIMVEEMKVALPLNESKDGSVSATELKNRVKELMDSDIGKEIRQRVFKMKISAKEGMAEGGSSSVALNRLAELWKQNRG